MEANQSAHPVYDAKRCNGPETEGSATPGEQPPADPGRELRVENALLYLDEVKLEFQDRPIIYDEFLFIMKKIRSQEVDTPGVIARVSTLFRGYNNLILGFNTFLPDRDKISLSDLDRQEAEREAEERKGSMKAQQARPGPKPKQAKPQTVVRPVPMGMQQVPPSQQPPVTKSAIPQMKPRYPALQPLPPRQPGPQPAVRGRAGDEASLVHSSQAIPGQIHQQSSLMVPRPSPSSQRNVPSNSPAAVLIPSRPPLQVVSSSQPPAAAPFQQQVVSSSPPPAAAPVQQQQQHAAHKGVELDYAISYVTTIKRRFSNDPGTYKSFLGILHAYEKEQRSIREVLEQVVHLFQDHPDLLKEFTFFVPDAVQEQAKEQLHRAAAESESCQAAQRRHMMDQYESRVGPPSEHKQVVGTDIGRRPLILLFFAMLLALLVREFFRPVPIKVPATFA